MDDHTLHESAVSSSGLIECTACVVGSVLPDKLTTNTKGNDSGHYGHEYPMPVCPIITYKQTISIKARIQYTPQYSFAFTT